MREPDREYPRIADAEDRRDNPDVAGTAECDGRAADDWAAREPGMTPTADELQTRVDRL